MLYKRITSEVCSFLAGLHFVQNPTYGEWRAGGCLQNVYGHIEDMMQQYDAIWESFPYFPRCGTFVISSFAKIVSGGYLFCVINSSYSF